MASGKTHFALAVAFGPVVSAASLYAGCSIPESLAYGALQTISGTLLSSDLDGPCLAHRYWMGLFLPYKNWFKHRSPFTHLPGLGIGIRLLYLAVAVNLALFLFRAIHWGALYQIFAPGQYMSEIGAVWVAAYGSLTRQQMAMGFGALTIGEALHSAADLASSWSKGQGWYAGAHHK